MPTEVAARSWRPALVLAPVLGFVAGAFVASNLWAGLIGAPLGLGLLLVLHGASTLSVDDSGLTLTQLGRTRRIEWSEATEVVCWVREPWGGRTSPLRVEVTAKGQPPSPNLALPVSLRVDMIRRTTAQKGAAKVQEQAEKAGVPATITKLG